MTKSQKKKSHIYENQLFRLKEGKMQMSSSESKIDQ